MICENCGAPIGKRDNHCPECGMELFNSEHKPLQKKYLRGEYLPDESSTDYLDYETDSDQTYQKEPYQNWDDYDRDPHDDYHQNDYGGLNKSGSDHEYDPKNSSNPTEHDLSQDTDFHKDNNDYDKPYNSERNYYKKNKKNKSYDNGYDRDRSYDNRHGKNKGYKGKYSQENYSQKKPVRRGYDLDAYYGSEEKQSSILKTAILFLVLALLIGFVMGFIFFSGKIQNILT